MPAGYQDLFLEKGTTFVSQLSLTDDYGNPYNLTGFTISSQARLSYYSANAAIVFDSSVVDANNGTIQITASAATTANVYAGAANKLVYDVIIRNNGNVSRVLEGQIYVSQSVTR